MFFHTNILPHIFYVKKKIKSKLTLVNQHKNKRQLIRLTCICYCFRTSTTNRKQVHKNKPLSGKINRPDPADPFNKYLIDFPICHPVSSVQTNCYQSNAMCKRLWACSRGVRPQTNHPQFVFSSAHGRNQSSSEGTTNQLFYLLKITELFRNLGEIIVSMATFQPNPSPDPSELWIEDGAVGEVFRIWHVMFFCFSGLIVIGKTRSVSETQHLFLQVKYFKKYKLLNVIPPSFLKITAFKLNFFLNLVYNNFRVVSNKIRKTE